jgi:hypothetical protein
MPSLRLPTTCICFLMSITKFANPIILASMSYQQYMKSTNCKPHNYLLTSVILYALTQHSRYWKLHGNS